MKKISILFGLTISAMIIMTSCGGSGTSENTENKEKQEPAKEEMKQAKTNDLETQMALGEKIYNDKCIVCHQADAKGIKGAFPPLAGSDYLLQDPKRGIHQTLNGSNEKMVVNGETFNAPMTPQVETREEALAVINYVLKHFNGYSDDKLLKMDDIMDVEIKPMKQQ